MASLWLAFSKTATGYAQPAESQLRIAASLSASTARPCGAESAPRQRHREAGRLQLPEIPVADGFLDRRQHALVLLDERILRSIFMFLLSCVSSRRKSRQIAQK